MKKENIGIYFILFGCYIMMGWCILAIVIYALFGESQLLSFFDYVEPAFLFIMFAILIKIGLYLHYYWYADEGDDVE